MEDWCWSRCAVNLASKATLLKFSLFPRLSTNKGLKKITGCACTRESKIGCAKLSGQAAFRLLENILSCANVRT